MKKYLGVFYLLSAAFLYGWFAILSRTVGYTIPIFYQNFIRAVVASTILFVIVLIERAWIPIQRNDWIVIIARSLAGSVAFLSFFIVILAVPIGPSYFLFYGGSTVIGFWLGHVWFSEHLTSIKAISLLFAVIGLGIVYGVNVQSISLFYAVLAFAAGSATAVWNVISKKISHRYKASYLSFWDDAITILTYGAISLVAKEQWTSPSLSTAWLASNGLGVFYVVTGLLMVEGFKRIEAQIGSIILLAEIIFAIFLGWVFYREALSLLNILGGIFIVTAIILPEIYTRRR